MTILDNNIRNGHFTFAVYGSNRKERVLPKLRDAPQI